MSIIIYLAQCNSNDGNNYFYVGQTKLSIEQRKEQHEHRARNNDSAPFHRALIDQGLLNWIWSILATCDPSEANKKEREYIGKFHEQAQKDPKIILLNSSSAKKLQKNSTQKSSPVNFPRRLLNTYEKSDLGKICLRLSGKLKPVRNLKTGRNYDSILEAERIDNVSRCSIKNSCDTGKKLKDGSSYAYLTIDDELDLKDGHSKDRYIGKRAKKIKNLVNDKVYENANQAATEYGVSSSVIAGAASGKYAIVKGNSVLCYVDDNGNAILKDKHIAALEKIKNKDQINFVAWYIDDSERKQPFFFKTSEELCKKLGIKNKGHVKSVCDGKRSHVEKWRIAYWDPIKKIPVLTKRHSDKPSKVIKRVVCLDSGEVFPNAFSAGKYYGLNDEQIRKCASGKQKTVYWKDSITKKKKRLRFAYVDSQDNPILTEMHKASAVSLSVRGDHRIMLLDDAIIGGSGKTRTFNSLAEFCRITNFPPKRAKKIIDGRENHLPGYEFVTLD